MPSIQGLIRRAFPADSLAILAANNTSSTTWLANFKSQWAITFPFVFDSTSALFNLYQVGSSFANNPPSDILIDTLGIVRYRWNDQTGIVQEIKSRIRELLQ